MELNIYGDISGGAIFDIMDREAHKRASSWIGDCLTASASINYVSPLDKDENYGLFHTDTFISKNKISIYVWLQTDDDRVIATASFLFIAKKNPSA